MRSVRLTAPHTPTPPVRRHVSFKYNNCLTGVIYENPVCNHIFQGIGKISKCACLVVRVVVEAVGNRLARHFLGNEHVNPALYVVFNTFDWAELMDDINKVISAYVYSDV